MPAVPWTDPRILEPSAAASIMFGHLDMIRTFLDGPAQYGIFCEDDILIRRDFNTTLDLAISTYAQKGLDVLLLGSLTLKTFGPEFTFHPVTHDTWGAQIYLLNRQAAFNIHAAFSNPREVAVFSADWTITKFGRAEFMYLCLQLRRETQRRAIWITWGTMRHATLPITTHGCTADAHYKTPTESGGGNILTQQRRNPIQLPDTESIMSLTNATPLGSRKMTPGLHNHRAFFCNTSHAAQRSGDNPKASFACGTGTHIYNNKRP